MITFPIVSASGRAYRVTIMQRFILIRFIRSNRILNIFGERFKVAKDLVYSYVKAVIVTEIQTLQLYLNDKLVKSFDYKLRD